MLPYRCIDVIENSSCRRLRVLDEGLRVQGFGYGVWSTGLVVFTLGGITPNLKRLHRDQCANPLIAGGGSRGGVGISDQSGSPCLSTVILGHIYETRHQRTMSARTGSALGRLFYLSTWKTHAADLLISRKVQASSISSNTTCGVKGQTNC